MKNIFITFNKRRVYPNPWDGLALILIFGIITLLAITAEQMKAPYHLGNPLTIHLGIEYLPDYALHSVVRMLIALVASLLFTFIVGACAAKSKYAERILIPSIDVLQSVPVLGLLSITVLGFIKLFPNSMMGPECASIFAVFTAQAWNMTLGFYQSLKTVPANLMEASHMFHLSAWQRFWRVEVPFAMPGLLWNTMMSMSASWFFVVASEAISVNNQSITLPGIGSYIATAIKQANSSAIVFAIIAMFFVILLYDQLLFRPLIAWGEKFKAEESASENEQDSWLLTLFQRSRWLSAGIDKLDVFLDAVINFSLFRKRYHTAHYEKVAARVQSVTQRLVFVALFVVIGYTAYQLYGYLFEGTDALTLSTLKNIVIFAAYTALRVVGTILFCTLVFVPIGVWIGLRPRLTQRVQPIIQFLAAFPAYLLYPVFVIGIIHFNLNPNIWTTPLFLLGTLWYVLFNVIAGTSALPKDLHEVAQCFELHGWRRWYRFILPGIFPYYITGAITAAGGAWNASIVAELMVWGKHSVIAQGIGSYISQATTAGNFQGVTLGIIVLCLMVIILNRLIWRPLYVLAQKRYQLD